VTQKDFNAALQSHKEWLGNRHGAGRRADLRGADLRHVNLEAADLRFADCRACDFSGANLSKAQFDHADCRGANFAGAICIGTRFVNARLEAANMAGVDLRVAVMEFAQMGGANLNSLLRDNRQPSQQQQKPKSKDRGIEMER